MTTPHSADLPLRDEPVAVPVHTSTVVYDGAVWDVRADTFSYGAGTLTREYLDHPGAVAILALNSEGEVLLIKQYRHPIRMREWELPAGLLDQSGESPLAAAQRELAEEADLAAESWELLTEFVTSPGGSNEAIRVYLARGLRATPRFDREAEEADLELRWVSLDDAVAAVCDRRIGNVITQVSVLAAQMARERKWEGLASADLPWPRHPAQRP